MELRRYNYFSDLSPVGLLGYTANMSLCHCSSICRRQPQKYKARKLEKRNVRYGWISFSGLSVSNWILVDSLLKMLSKKQQQHINH